jgi:hypothetical protein
MNCFKQGRKEKSKMSKLILSILLIMVLVISLVVMSGCSDKKSNNTTGLTYEDLWDDEYLAKNWDIGVFVRATQYCECCDEYNEGEISISKISEDAFKTLVTLRINGSEVELKLEWCCENCGHYYRTDYDFKGGNTYKILITHAGRNHEVNIQVPNELKITSTSPTVFNPTAPFRVDWTMQGNTNIQGIEWYADGNDWDEEVGGIVNLPSNARNYTLPADTVPRNFDRGGIFVIAANYATSGRVLFVSSNGDDNCWVSFRNDDYYSRSKSTKAENHKERMQKAINLIQKSNM